MNNNIKDFILQGSIEDAQNIIPQKVVKAKPKAEYETVFASVTDFAIRKKTTRTSVVFVAIVSQDQFYFKNESNGGTIEALNRDNLVKFTKDMPEEGVQIVADDGSTVNWIKTMQKGSNWADSFIAVRKNDDCIFAIRNDMFDFETYSIRYTYNYMGALIPNSNFKHEVRIVFNLIAEHIGHNRAKKEFCNPGSRTRSLMANLFLVSSNYWDRKQNNPLDTCCKFISDRWGLEGVKQMVSMYLETPVTEFPRKEVLERLFIRNAHVRDSAKKDTVFDLRSFVDYAFCECTRQGFAEDGNGFWNLWADYMDQQYFLYGEIRDKYSEKLASDEKITAYKTKQLQKQISKDQFQQAAEFLKQFEYEGRDFCILAPKTPEDVIEEGREMSHCVGSYVESIAKLNTYIFFMRSTKAKEKSLVTVELYPSGALGQVRARFNRKPSDEQLAFVEKWHRQFFADNNMRAAS